MGQLRDVPVCVALEGGLADEVLAFTEAELGWQVVGPDGPPAPLLALAAAVVADRPTVVVLDGGAGGPDAGAVRAALLAGALDVVAWPQERHRLVEAAGRLGAAARPTGAGSPGALGTPGAAGTPGAVPGRRLDAEPRRAEPALLAVGGAAGGVGTSTVALAAAGLLAWGGARTVVVGGEGLLRLAGCAPWTGAGALELAALPAAHAGAELDALSRPVDGVEGLRVLGGWPPGAPPPVDGWPVDAVVADLGVVEPPGAAWTDPAGAGPPGRAPAADLVVARPDGALVALADWGTVPVLLVGQGPLDEAGVRRLLRRRPLAWLPWSARVARAGLQGRVPGALPGSWLAALRTALGRVAA